MPLGLTGGAIPPLIITIIIIISQLARTACCVWVFPINQLENLN
jgi:hypothetical protein